MGISKTFEKKQIGMILAVATLLYKVSNFFMYMNSIFDWWGGAIFLYFILYFTSVCTIYASFSRKTTSIAISISMIVVSIIFLIGDIFAFLGFMASLNSTPLKEMGIMPFVNLMNALASCVIIVESALPPFEIRIPFHKFIPGFKVQTVRNGFFKLFNIIDIVCIVAACSFFLYLTDGKEHAYHGSGHTENRAVNAAINYLEKTYSEDINMYSSAGPKGEVYKIDDPDRPGCNTYYVQLYWKNVPVTAYVEIKGSSLPEIYKENFQSKKFAHILQDHTGGTVVFEDFVSGTPVVYDTCEEYFASLPEDHNVLIELKWCDEDVRLNYRDKLKKIAEELPKSARGTFLIHFYYTENNENHDLITVSFPFANKGLYLSQITAEEDKPISYGAAILLGMDRDNLYNMLADALIEYPHLEKLFDDSNPDLSSVKLGNPVNEYMYDGGSLRGYFSYCRYFYPVLYNGKAIAVFRLAEAGDGDWHYEIFESKLAEVINEIGSGNIAFCYDPDYVYFYNGEELNRLFETDEIVGNRFGDVELKIEDADLSTDVIEHTVDVNYSNIELTYVNLDY